MGILFFVKFIEFFFKILLMIVKMRCWNVCGSFVLFRNLNFLKIFVFFGVCCVEIYYINLSNNYCFFIVVFVRWLLYCLGFYVCGFCYLSCS